jgi:hypothetical protein
MVAAIAAGAAAAVTDTDADEQPSRYNTLYSLYSRSLTYMNLLYDQLVLPLKKTFGFRIK